MKIAIIRRGALPSYSAHCINTMKHADGFHKLHYKVEILTVQSIFKRITKNDLTKIHDIYGISKKIRIIFFNDYSIQNLKYISTLRRIFLKFNPRFRNPLNKKNSQNKSVEKDKKKHTILNKSFKVLMEFLIKLNNVNSPYKRIAKYCERKNIALAYCRAYEAAYYCIRHKISVLFEIHLPNPNNPEFRRFVKLSKNKYFKGIITIHPIIRDSLIEAGIPSNKILILEDAVDLEKYDAIKDEKVQLKKRLNLPLDKKIILYTGSLIEGRGIETIIEAAKILSEVKVAFYIVGGTPTEIKKWKSFMQSKNINVGINFLGFIENRIIPLYQKSADILLAPYSSRCNTLNWMSPIKIFEYMASKVPIIASDLSRIKEICNNDECLIFKADEPLDLSIKINKILEDLGLQKELIENAYNKVKMYTYSIRCKKIIEKFL